MKYIADEIKAELKKIGQLLFAGNEPTLERFIRLQKIVSRPA
jgi:hypothetical protein